MANPILTKQRVIGFKSETIQNTAVTLTPSDYILAEVGQPQPMYDLLPRNYAHATLGTLLHSVGKVYVEVKVKVEMKWTGSTSQYAPLCALLKACGNAIVEDNLPDTTDITPISFAPVNMLSSATSLTADWYMNGIRHTVAGCVASSAKLTFVVGELSFFEVTLRGLYQSPINSAFPSTSYLTETLRPPIYSSTNFAFDAINHIISKFEFDFGLETSLRENTASSLGVGGFVITGKNPVGSFDPELQTPSGYNYIDKIKSGAYNSLTTYLGTELSNSFIIICQRVQMNSFALADRGGKAVANIPLSMREINGDDSYIISVLHT